jgi:hypothetical protein
MVAVAVAAAYGVVAAEAGACAGTPVNPTAKKPAARTGNVGAARVFMTFIGDSLIGERALQDVNIINSIINSIISIVVDLRSIIILVLRE